MCRELLVLGFIFLVHAQKLDEGSRCTDTGGVEGICRKARVCPSVALNPQKEAEVICSYDGAEPVVCCTDCYINDVSNAVATSDGIVWKTAGARRAYDKCVEYASTLPYACNMGSLRLAVNKEYDPKQRCHRLKVSVRQQPPTKPPPPPTAEFPYLALLGYMSMGRNEWKCQGIIISERFVLTTAHCRADHQGAPLDNVAVGIDKRRGGHHDTWEIYMVKRVLTHPEYKSPRRYNDIGLVETDTPIKFNMNVLPICLADQLSDPEIGKIDVLPIEGIQENSKTVDIQRMSEEACSAAFRPNRNLALGINHTTQACYPNLEEAKTSCLGSSGRPVYTSGELKCMKYAVGLTTFGTSCEKSAVGVTVYSRIPSYISWIEDTVWPSSN